jgi:hypothetical protein
VKQVESFKKARSRELNNKARTKSEWSVILKHFAGILVENDLPNNNGSLVRGDKKRLRREANNRAMKQDKSIKQLSGDRLSKKLIFPK